MTTEIIEVNSLLSPTVVAAIVGAISGVIAGIISSLIAPWVQWAIQKRKADLAYRHNIISDLRKLILEAEDFESIKYSSYWGLIEQHLEEWEKQSFTPPSMSSGVAVIANMLPPNERKKQILSTVVHRIELKWKLL